MTALLLGSTLLASYLVGSIPFGYLVARGRGVDILRHGSGNIGATNVGRVLGRPFGALVFLLDFLKGALPTWIAAWLASRYPLDLPVDSLPVAAAMAAFLGHLFPIYLRFRGGRGVATAAGAVLVLVPQPMLAALTTFLAVALASRYVSLASLTAAVVLCVFRLAFTPRPWDSEHRIVTLFCLLSSLLIFVRHRANLGRLLRGNENRLQETPAMLHFSKIVHVLALGLWFGTAVFFSLVVGVNLFDTFGRIAAETPADRPRWLPMWEAFDGPSPDPIFAEPLRKEQGTRAAGVALDPLFHWYFGIQMVCGLLAVATAFAWRHAGRAHRFRFVILAAALIAVAGRWWLDRGLEELRQARNATFDAMVSHSPPQEADVQAAVKARAHFVRAHFGSLYVNLITVLVVTIGMGLAAFLPNRAASGVALAPRESAHGALTQPRSP